MIEDFRINYLNTGIIMMPLYKGENRSEMDRELPKATQLIMGGLRFKSKSSAWATLEPVQLSRQWPCQGVL